MQILIIEDEAFAADALETMIVKLRPQTLVLDKLENIEESVDWFRNNKQPDLIFCDIHLSDGSSFEIFKKIEVRAPIIFTTAYNEYALEAFKVNSVDYLLKPIDQKELSGAIEKYENLQRGSLSEEIRNLQNLISSEAFDQKKEKKTRFIVKSGQTIRTISGDQVAYFLAEDGVVLLVNFEGKRFVINYTLENLEEQLEKKTFFRANRHLIVNINAVREVNPYFKGRLQLVLEPPIAGDQVISSNKASDFKEWLDL